MKQRPSISSYTPSNTDPEVLERILVQREKLLSTLVRRLVRSMSTGDKHHILLIGPRGSGKTHFLTLAQFRLHQNADLADSMRIAWLGEDVIITGMIDLALEIANQLAVEYPAEFDADFRSPVRLLPPDDAAEAILHDIARRLDGRNLLIMMENLDRAFHGLGDTGQKKWRAFLQETGKVATLATSQQLFEGISDRNEAFFGFFDIHHLKPLSVEHALQLIAKVAHEYDNRDLIEFLSTNEGRYRVRALRHLAGGNHRMYILLSEFLTRESLDDLVAAFEQLAEELTPYFQERVRSLSPQQARIVQCLCNADGAMTVKSVAEDTFIPERNCSKQLGELKRKRYVTSQRRGKESYYEMAEPLMRLCLEVKNQRGRPLRLISMFLRAWFPMEALQTAKGASIPGTRADLYRMHALKLDDRFETRIRQEFDQDIEEKLGSKRFDDALFLAEELACMDHAGGLLKEAYIRYRAGRPDAALSCLTDLVEMTDGTVAQHASALVNRGVIYGEQGKTKLALADYAAVIKMTDAPAAQRALALVNRGATYGEQGKTKLALIDSTAAIEMTDAPAEQRAMALVNRGVTYGRQEENGVALADFTAVIEMTDAPAEQRAMALVNRGVTYGRQEENRMALADFTAVIEMTDAPVDQRAKTLVNRGITYDQQGRIKLGLADYTAVIEMTDAPPDQRAKALVNRGVTHGQQGKTKLGLADYTAVIGMTDTPAAQRALALVNRGATYVQQGKTKLGLADYTAVIGMPDAPAGRRAMALVNSAATYWHGEEFERSLRDYSALIEETAFPAQIRREAMFFLPESIIPIGSRADAMAALTRAFEEGEPTAEYYGGTPHDLLKVVLRKGHCDWASYVSDLVSIYVKHDACAKLCNGLTRSIEFLDAGDYSPTQLDAWNDAWQEAGRGVEELAIALRSLSCAIQAIKTKSDRPLFELPLEVRELILPLLKKTLGA